MTSHWEAGVVPPDLRAIKFRFEADDWLVLSYEPHLVELPEELTAAEGDVVRGVLRDESNAEIAARRGSSVRTVANQLASIFRKLGVFSRAELVHRVLVGGAPCPQH